MTLPPAVRARAPHLAVLDIVDCVGGAAPAPPAFSPPPDAGSSTALLDRVVHHAEVNKIEGQSHRSRAAADGKKAKPTKKAA